MCITCDWSKVLSSSNSFPIARRRLLGQVGAFTATAVVAPPEEALARAPGRQPRTPPAAKDSGKADWLFLNGTIHTINPAQLSAQAVAVRGTKIVDVGDASGAADWRGPKTRVVDLQGRMLMPGFIDSHNHLASMGVTKLGVSIRGLVGKDKILDAINEWIATQPPDAPLRGHGWSANVSFGADSPRRREWLDEVTGDRPMYLWNEEAQQLWFNTAAMKAAGVSARTPNPDPGKQCYARDADHTPTGLAVEGAASLPMCVALGMLSTLLRLLTEWMPIGFLTEYADYSSGTVISRIG